MRQHRMTLAAFVLCMAIIQAQAPQPPAVANGAFARDANGKAAGWGFVCKDEKAEFEVVSIADAPEQTAVHIRLPGIRGLGQPWWFGSHKPIPVKTGQSYILSYRAKASSGTRVTLSADGWKGGKRVIYRLVDVHSVGPHQNWILAQQDFVCPDSIDEVRLAFRGSAGTDVLLDDVQFRPGKLSRPPVEARAFEGSRRIRVQEKLDRGMVAVPCADGTYIGWRLLATDAADVSFNLYRVGEPAGDKPVRLNRTPLRQTTDFVDATPAKTNGVYILNQIADGTETEVARCRVESCAQGAGAYRAIPLVEPVKAIDRIGVGDLDGDGRYDFVIKHPLGAVRLVDDYESKAFGGWSRSETTYKLEAYTQDGKRLWKNDLGWSIELRNWFSPMIVHDLDGDGCAEVAVKVGEGDPRNDRGRVESGPEWVMVWDGRTGRELARAPWPSRDGFYNYNFTSRNQLAIAYLDGKTPCLIALRGTYGLMKVDAYEYRDQQLRHLWSYSNLDRPREFWGQGAHFTQCVDVDGDGRDEVLLGSTVLDDTGVPLWTTGKGHADGMHAGDIDPLRPGLEVFYVIETRNQTGGLNMVDAATGQFLWQIDTPTTHCHTVGVCADLDPRHPGRECYGADKKFIKEAGKEKIVATWFRTAAGEDLPVPEGWSFGVPALYWDADLQKELRRGGKILKFGSTEAWPAPKATWDVPPMDILGDWREELLVLADNELRIHVSAIPAMDRRVCLMQDPIYRLDTAMSAQAYPQPAMLSYDPASVSPNLNLTFAMAEEGMTAHVVLSAPQQHGVKGTCTLAGKGVRFVPDRFDVDLPAGGIVEKVVLFGSDGLPAGPVRVTAHLEASADSLTIRRTVGTPPTPPLALLKYPHCEAESFASQTGGSIHIRTAKEKAGISGRCFSHWSKQGHSLAWQIQIPNTGTYRPVFRYSTMADATRSLAIDGTPCAPQTFPASGGFGEHPSDWHTHAAVTDAGKPLLLELPVGPHTIQMTVPATDKGLNLDLVALMPADR